MQTTATPARRADTPSVSADVRRYFEVLRAEQAKFLEAVASARTALPNDGGQLAQLTAVQGRLTRQFFDAQRSLLQRRAEVDAEVARIGAETEEHANVVLASAAAHAAAGHFAPPLASELQAGGDEPSSPAERIEHSTRQALAALGTLAMRSKADADALEQVVNDAFTPGEPDAARMERELQLVLDAWWTAEVQEGSALVEDARARAAMRLHLAHLEACEITQADAANHASTMPATLLPSSVVETLESSRDGGLESVLAALHRSLAPTNAPVPTAAMPSIALAHQVDERLDSPATAAPTPAEQFQHFWQHERHGSELHSLSLWSILRRIVLPMFAVTSGLALALAWIG